MKITDAESRWVAVWGQGWGLTAAGYKGSLYGDRTAPYLNWGERYVAAYVLFWPGHVACGMFPDQGLNTCPLHLEHEDLTTGTPGKSQSCIHCKKAWNYTATKANFICKLEAWTIKKAECRRIDAFKLWCERRLLRVPWTARRSKESILKEINPGNSLEGLMLKLKLQHFRHLMRRTTGKDLDAGKDWRQEGKGASRGWDGWMASLTQWTKVWANSRRQ